MLISAIAASICAMLLSVPVADSATLAEGESAPMVIVANAASIGCQRPVTIGKVSVTPGGDTIPEISDALRREIDGAPAPEDYPAPGPVIPPAAATALDAVGALAIADFLADPVAYNGATVILSGEFAGNVPSRLSDLADVPRANAMAYILRDTSGETFFSYPPDVEQDVELDPEFDQGKRVVVTGTGRISADKVPYVQTSGVYRRHGERGAFCGLEILEPDPEEDGALPIRLIFSNDTEAPIQLQYPAGVTHDLVVMQGGTEVWRLSRHRRPGFGEITRRQESIPALGHEYGARDEFIPGSAWRVYVDHWDMTDNAGQPVPPGRYYIQGVISRRIFTMPIPLEID